MVREKENKNVLYVPSNVIDEKGNACKHAN